MYLKPTWLKYIYNFFGIVQFHENRENNSTNSIPHLWPLPCYFSYLYVSIYTLVSYKTFAYFGMTRTIVYVDYLCFTVFFLSIITCFYVFFKRSNRLKQIFYQISTSGNPPDHRLNRWLKIYFAILVVANLVFIIILHLSSIDTALFYHLTYDIPMFLNVFELLFTADVVKTLQIKFCEINETLRKESDFTGKNIKISQRINQIKRISQRHFHFSNLAKDINDLFGTTMLPGMVSLFLTVITCIYYTLYLFSNFNFNQIITYLIFNILWLGTQGSWFYVLLKVWNDTQEEVIN